MIKILNSLRRLMGSAKFAIVLLLLFGLGMIVGTLLESKYGTLYAGRVIYYSWWFFVIQGLMAVSLIVAVLDRWPFRKRLLGFYFIHASIVTIISGSFITRYFGIDGSVTLSRQQAVQQLQLPKEMLYLTMNNQQFSFPLPEVVTAQSTIQNLKSESHYKIDLVEFLPYAQPEMVWIPGGNAWYSRWLIVNDRMAQPFELMSEPVLDMGPEKQMGLLTLRVVNETLLKILEKNKKVQGGWLVQHRPTGEDYFFNNLPQTLSIKNKKLTLEKKEIKSASVEFFELREGPNKYMFFPKFSQYPVGKHTETILDSPYIITDLSNLGSAPTVLIAKSTEGIVKLAFRVSGDWKVIAYQNEPIPLPWMGFKLNLMKQFSGSLPQFIYHPGEPNKDEKFNQMAARIRLTLPTGESKEAWFSDRETQNITLNSLALTGFIGRKSMPLPFSLTLEKFKMDKIPGTNDPASFESFVNVSDQKELAHIYMNNPLKKGNLTFYQSSYFQDEGGEFQSVLSMNKDPGRWVKYLGSLFLILSLILHYLVINGVFPKYYKGDIKK